MDCKQMFTVQLFFCLIWHSFSQQGESNCRKAKAKTCGECVKAGPNCGWCKDLDFLEGAEPNSVRCDDVAVLLRKGCTDEEIENPAGQQVLLKNLMLTDQTKKTTGNTGQEAITQIQPQKLLLNLRLGEPQTFSVKYKRVMDHRVDLYYLIRLYNSTEEDLQNAKNLGISLLQEMQNLTSDLKIGFGSFVERNVMPSTSESSAKNMNPCTADENCATIVSFKHVLSLTPEGRRFRDVVEKHCIPESLGQSDGGLDALVQIASCHDQIGWRNATRLLVISTDAGFNFAPAGDQGETVLPNYGQCHMDKNTNHQHKSPSIGQLAQILSENNIQTIFAVPEELQPLYKPLEKRIPGFGVGTLSANSSSVIQQIVDTYNSLSTEVVFRHSNLPKGITVSYKSFCKNGANGTEEDGRKCTNISIGDEVHFRISVTAQECPRKAEEETIKFMVPGSSEEIEVVVRPICACDCQRNARRGDPRCHTEDAILECGACRCNKGRVGKWCECDTDEDANEDDMVASCTQTHSSQICSNNGECICGQCSCKKRDNPDEIYSGLFCECDNFSCDRVNGLICGGNGICICGMCSCYPQYGGSACECPFDLSTCVAANGQICNGKGYCQCGRCQCSDTKYQGPTCEMSATHASPCAEYKECVQCRAFNTGEKKNVCAQECMHFNYTMVESRDKLPQPGQADMLMHCKERDADGSWFYFTYLPLSSDDILVHVVEKAEQKISVKGDDASQTRT